MSNCWVPIEQQDQEIASRSLYGFVRIAWQHVDAQPYVDGQHIRVICEALEKVSRGEIKRLVINLPPGMSKSTLLGVLWPAWDWIKNRGRRWFYGSYDSSLLNTQSSKLIKLLNGAWFKARWGEMLEGSNPAVSEFTTKGGGSRFNTSFGGKGIGRHAHIQVFDDPIKPKDLLNRARTFIDPAILDHVWELIAQTFASRSVDVETFARVIVMQRLHPQDPSGRALAAGWQGLRLPMFFEADNADPQDWRTAEGEPLCPARTSIAACLALKTENDRVDPAIWETQYQQRPQAKAGAIIQLSWVLDNAVTFEQLRGLQGRRIQSWDLTFKGEATSDYIAGQPWLCTTIEKELHFFMTHEPVFMLADFLKTLDMVEAHIKGGWPAAEIWVEDKANGPAVMSVLRKKFKDRIKAFEPQGSKSERLHSCAPLFAARQVHYVKGPWLDRIAKTLNGFPAVRRDDEVDATTQALITLDSGLTSAQALTQIQQMMGGA